MPEVRSNGVKGSVVVTLTYIKEVVPDARAKIELMRQQAERQKEVAKRAREQLEYQGYGDFVDSVFNLPVARPNWDWYDARLAIAVALGASKPEYRSKSTG